MHNNYFFLRQLSKELEEKLKGFVLVEAYSQNKNEVIFGFSHAEEEFFIHASLKSDFCCLFFPAERTKAKKNYALIFREIYGLHVIEVHQNSYDRSFRIKFENEFELLFKMHGNRSNVLLFKEGQLLEVFNSALKNDFNLKIDELEKSRDLSFENFRSNDGDINRLSAVFGKEIHRKMDEDGYPKLPLEEKWKYFNSLLEKLDKPAFYISTDSKSEPRLTLLKDETAVVYSNAISCINAFFIEYSKQQHFNRLFTSLQKTLEGKIRKTEKYVQNAESNLEKIISNNNYKNWADLIMANLHQLQTGIPKTELDDFYTNSKVTIPLKKNLSPQKNAENYYRKSKNQKLEIENLEKNISSKKKELQSLQEIMIEVDLCDDIKSLKRIESDFFNRESQKSTEDKSNKPYREFLKNSYKIWLGKNAKRNDELTLKYASKNDLWLHAKDVPGSHVIIKEQAGKKIPKDVIEYAASLAASYSKRKNENLCPVIVTPKKFVRKPKGLPPGAVIVEKEEVIMVPPLVNH